MEYPILTALFGTLFACGYKIATMIKANRSIVNAVYLLGSSVMIGGLGWLKGQLDFNATVIVIGAIGGVTVYSCVAAFFQVMRYGRLSIQWTIISMAIAVPVAASIVFWGERPSSWAISGFVLTAAALIFMGVDKGTTAHTDDSNKAIDPSASRRGRLLWIVLVLIAYFGTGFTQVCNKAMVQYGQGDNKYTYLFLLNGVGGLLALVQAFWRRPEFCWRSVGIGSGMILSGLICTWFLLLGLQNLEAMVFFPLRAIFSIIFTTGLSVALWKERIRTMGIIGLVIAAIAICCLGMA